MADPIDARRLAELDSANRRLRSTDPAQGIAAQEACRLVAEVVRLRADNAALLKKRLSWARLTPLQQRYSVIP